MEKYDSEKNDGAHMINDPFQSLAQQEGHEVPLAEVNSIISSNINSFSGNESHSNCNSGGSLQQICRRWLKHTYLGIGEPCVSAGLYDIVLILILHRYIQYICFFIHTNWMYVYIHVSEGMMRILVRANLCPWPIHSDAPISIFKLN